MYTWESLSDPPRKLSMYVLYVMLHAALSGLPLCKRGHTNITFLFGNSFLLSLLLTFSFYSNWYGCQPLLGTQNHPGPKVHTGTVTTSDCPKRQRRAACESKLSSTWQLAAPIRPSSCLLWIFATSGGHLDEKTVTHLKKDEKDQEEGPCRPETVSHQRIIAKMSWQKLKNSAKREIHQVWPPTKF